MKLKLFVMTIIVMLISPLVMMAQELPPTIDIPTDPAAWFALDRVEWVYGIIVVIGGYLSAFIPGLKNITVGVYRVLTWALITGAGAVMLGSSIWGVAITYFISTGLYDIVLKLILKSPKPKDRYGNEIEGRINPLIG